MEIDKDQYQQFKIKRKFREIYSVSNTEISMQEICFLHELISNKSIHIHAMSFKRIMNLSREIG